MSSAFDDGAKYISGLARSRRVRTRSPSPPTQNFQKFIGLMLSGPVRTSDNASPYNGGPRYAASSHHALR